MVLIRKLVKEVKVRRRRQKKIQRRKDLNNSSKNMGFLMDSNKRRQRRNKRKRMKIKKWLTKISKRIFMKSMKLTRKLKCQHRRLKCGLSRNGMNLKRTRNNNTQKQSRGQNSLHILSFTLKIQNRRYQKKQKKVLCLKNKWINWSKNLEIR